MSSAASQCNIGVTGMVTVMLVVEVTCMCRLKHYTGVWFERLIDHMVE